MSIVWAKDLTTGLQIERVLKMVHKNANIVIKTENGKVFYEGIRGNIFRTKLLNHDHDNDIVRLKIKNIEIGADDTFAIVLCNDKYEEKHYSNYYYDDEFYNLAKQKWNSMINRTTNGRYKCYDEVEVCEEWKDFSNFYEWFKDNWIDCNDRVDLDKDLINKNAKIYSPQTCCFIPHSLNMAIVISNKQKAKGVVSWDKTKQSYRVILTIGKYHINTHRCIYKDALDVYFEKKDEFVKAMAEDFKDVVNERVYDALMKYNSRELYLEKFGDYPSEYYE